MRSALLVLALLTGCVAAPKTAIKADMPIASPERKVEQGDNSKYSSGAGWMFGAFCVFAAYSTYRHWRSSQHRQKMEGMLSHRGNEREMHGN